MTEPEYILTGDLRTTLQMQSMLRFIIRGNNPHVTDDEYTEVAKILDAWQARMFKAVKIKP